jgi:transposase
MRGVDAETQVYLWLGVTDMRAGFERLSQLVRDKQQRSVIAGGLYVFLSRCRKRVKILYWDRDGYALWYKRLEAGTLKVSKTEEVEILSGVDLSELLMGIDLARIKLKKSAEIGLYS